ncbi:putative nicotinate-nucleotide adenylyltransferase [Planctomycetota bacterium]|nr:putative nicotinate-nucleotide adenylyltransferase [Planctomycetota bacterium]
MALFGGSFNPPHRSHRRIAEDALRLLPVAELRVLPAGDHPHKHHRDMATASHRLAMCQITFAGLANCFVDDCELRRKGPSFTVDTLQELRLAVPDRELFFLIGSDNLPLLPSWHNHHRILQLARVVTFPRLGYAINAEELRGKDLTAAERASLLDMVLPTAVDEISSSELRARLLRGERQLAELPAGVEDYIHTHQSYGG